MPPKRATSRRIDNPTSKQFSAKQIVEEKIGTVSSKHTQCVGEFFTEIVGDIKRIFKRNLESIDVSENFTIVSDDLESQIVYMATTKVTGSSIIQQRSPLKTIPNCQFNEERVKKDIPSSSRSLIVTENDSVPTEGSTTPPITSETTEEELENEIIPKTVTRLQALSVKRLGGTPRNPFSVNLASQTPIAATSTPKKTLRNCKPLVFEQINKTPKASKPTAPVTRVAQDEKMKHASCLKEKFLQQKIAKAKENDDKMRAAKERKMELDRIKQEKLEEKRKKERMAAEFQRAAENHILKSPSRLGPSKSSSRLQALQKSPSRYIPSCSTPRGKTTQSSQELTPGRRPAKFGRVETFNEVSAHPTVPVSPSRSRARSIHKHRSIEEEQKPEVNIHIETKTAAQEEAERQLRATQEAYLLQQSQEAKQRIEREEAEERERIHQTEQLEQKRLEEDAEMARIVEEKRLEEERQIEKALLKAKKEAEAEKVAKEKLEEKQQKNALKLAKKTAEAERLARLQKEEAERLRIEEEKEKKSFEETVAKQTASSKNAPNSYQMTPPRVYVSNSKEDYGLNDLNSDDETDQEDEPRKKVPGWAEWAVVRRSARELALNMPFDMNEFFGEIDPINLKLIFGEKVKPKKRGSSAVWKSPMSNSKSTTPKLAGIKE